MTNPDNVVNFIKDYNMTNNCHKQFIAIFMIASGLHITFHRKAFNSVYPSHFGFTNSKCLQDVIVIISNFAQIASKAWFTKPTQEQITNFFKEISIPLSCRFANTFGIKAKPCYRLKRRNDNANCVNEWLYLISLSDKTMIYRIIAIYYACENFVKLHSCKYNLQKNCLH